jgi:hypothetical protein
MAGGRNDFNQAVFRTVANTGDKTKHYVHFTDTAIFITKLVLSKEPKECWADYEPIKTFKDHILYRQIFAAKNSSFIQYMHIFVQYQNNQISSTNDAN